MARLLTSRLFIFLLAGYGLAALVVILIAPLIGAEDVNVAVITKDLLSQNWHSDSEIFFFQRIPRVILGFVAGGTLALVGSVFQVILRNPLATPYTLGVTAGGALGAVIAISIPGLVISFGPFSTIQIFAIFGSGITLGIIYYLARSKTGLSMNSLLLTGVTMGIFCGAMILLVRYLVSPHRLVAMDRWMMGGVQVVAFQELASLLPFLLPGLILLFSLAAQLNHLSLGEEMASGHGIDVARVQMISFLGGGLATAAVVSVTGPIGFLGLIIPHAVRKLSGFDHRVVLPASFLLGGSLLVVCDTIARTIVAPTEMPVGIITALVGGPVFIRLIISRSKR